MPFTTILLLNVAFSMVQLQASTYRGYYFSTSIGLTDEFKLMSSVESAFIRNCLDMCLVRCDKNPSCWTVTYSNEYRTCQFFDRLVTVSAMTYEVNTDLYTKNKPSRLRAFYNIQ